MPWSPPPSEITLTIRIGDPQPVSLDPASSVLVIVDMENYFANGQHRRMHDAIDGNVALLAKARAAGVKVIFIQSVRSTDALEFTVFGRPHHIIEGTPAVEIVEELTPLPGETVIQKRSHDAWNDTGLTAELDRCGLEPGKTDAIVTGVSAAVCARACALGFSHRDYRVWVPMDCTTAATAEEEAMVWAQYQSPAYSYNTHLTLGSLIDFSRREADRVGVAARRA